MEFKAKLRAEGPGGAWTILTVPFNVEEVFGSKARVSVKGTINGYKFRSSIFPDGRGHHTLMVNKAMQHAAQAKAGNTVRVEMEPDTEPRTVTVPAGFKRALAGNAPAKAAFAKLSWLRKKDFVQWIESAKQPETRAARVEKSLGMLAAGQHVNR